MKDVNSTTDSFIHGQGYEARMNGNIHYICAANNTLWIATEKHHVLRWNLATDDQQDIEVSKQGTHGHPDVYFCMEHGPKVVSKALAHSSAGTKCCWPEIEV